MGGVTPALVTGTTIEATGDTSAGDNAAMGYTATEGLILTGQGSTNDITIKNDADADVMTVATGTQNATFAANVSVPYQSLLYFDGGGGSGNTYIISNAPDTLELKTNGTTALLLNATQNATFAGDVTVNGTGLSLTNATNPVFSVTDTTNSVQTFIQSTDTGAIIGSLSNHPLLIQSNNTTALTFDVSQNATFAGDVTVTGTVTGTTGVAAVQTVYSQDGETATTVNNMDMDDSIPQNTEGAEFMSVAITPISATNTLRIDVVAMVTESGTPQGRTVALFQDSTAGALAAMGGDNSTTSDGTAITFTHWMTAGTTSATTFKVRAGPNGTGTLTFNGISGRLYGGVMASSITITEYQA